MNQYLNKMKTVVLIAFILLIIPTLSGQDGNKSKVTVLNLEEAFSRQQEVPLSRFVDKITYIPLENNPKALIGDVLVNYEVTDEYIIVKNGTQQLLLFSRKTGEFIREIGKQGRGPGEFGALSNLPYNPVKHELYALNYSGDILVYDLSGKNIDIIKIPYLPDPKLMDIPNLTKGLEEVFSKIFLRFYNILDTNIFIGYFQNYSGWENRKIIMLTKAGVLKIFPNYLTWDRGLTGGFMNSPGGFAKFYRWDNKVYFLEIFCDTLYEVTKEKLIPRYYFDIGSTYKAEYSKQAEVASKWYNYYFMQEIKENKNYIFIQFWLKREIYIGFIEKKNNNVTICKIRSSGNSALIDDVSGLMDVVPDHFTHNNEMVYVIKPAKLISWFKENPEKATQARAKLPWLKNIDEFSNPIIAIGKCKE